MTDFGPLIANPRTLLLGGGAQFGVFATMFCAVALGGFTLGEAASIGIIGGADGPTSIFTANKLAKHLSQSTSSDLSPWRPTPTWLSFRSSSRLSCA